MRLLNQPRSAAPTARGCLLAFLRQSCVSAPP